MKEKIYEYPLDKPVESVCETVDKSLKKGLFSQFGKFDYKWNNEKNKLFLNGKVRHALVGEVSWSAEIVFSKKKMVFFVDIPTMFKPFVIPKIVKELKEKIPGVIDPVGS